MAVHNLSLTGVMRSVNPATGEVMREFERDSDAGIENKLQRAADAFSRWRRVPFSERSAHMLRTAEILENEKQTLGRMMTLEMGKPLRAAIQEAEKCAKACRFYAENAENFLADQPAMTDAAQSFIRFQPLGPVLAVMPWNFPFWQVFRFAAPALMAGNIGLLKHASNVPQCAMAIADIFRRAGFPEAAFQTLLIGNEQVEHVIQDSRVAAVTLTGSVGAGSSVASVAGRHIKKTVLELGGSDPFIVMPSADFERAVATAVQARVINNGQSCIAAKRFIVHESIYDNFERRFVERMAALKIGAPLDEGTDVGPLATADMAATLEDQVNRTLQSGARLLLGGKRLPGKGNFYSPTVLADIPHNSPARTEEFFGPVASLFRVRGIEEAITMANDSNFGLASSCWTTDQREREMFITQVEAGMVFINAMVASDPGIPFGGIKQSGYGRELGALGIREFVNAKTVAIYETSAR
ncbi:MAG TPA: NAD-dependent succinate-semialdehyde dehydrogenase [Candidatus Angelobacter sp.]|nr:NAD-dependent succinate-semialdehyde dehydrogenase [Candidatus Angelobacter sp.]